MVILKNAVISCEETQIQIRFQKCLGPIVFSSFLRNRIFVIPRFRGVSKVGVVHKLRRKFYPIFGLLHSPYLTSLHCALKGSLISKVYFTLVQISIKGAKNYSEHLLFRWIMLSIVFWHLFLELWVKVKNLLRLSSL